MSWNKLKVDELRHVAEQFGVDVEEKAKKPQIIAALAEEGVTFDQYESFKGAEKVDPKKEVEGAPRPAEKAEMTEDDVLVKMDRANFRYDTHGFTFTKEHPYCVVPRDIAQAIFDTQDGFRMANPREVDEYYR